MIVAKKDPIDVIPKRNVKRELSVDKSYFDLEEIPSSFREKISKNIIKKLGDKIKISIDKLSKLKTKESSEILKNNITSLKNYISNIKKNIDRIRTIEAQENIANISLSGFQVKLQLDRGLQFNLHPDSDDYYLLTDIIRKYIFDYIMLNKIFRRQLPSN